MIKSLPNRVQPCIGLGIMLAMGSLSIGLNIRANRMSAEVAATGGGYSAQQILRQTGQLDALLAPVVEPYTYTQEYMPTYRLGRPDGGSWVIFCTNKSGTREDSFRWNAYSGQLESVVCTDPQDSNSANILSSRVAVDCTMEWAHALGLVKPHEPWELTEAPDRLLHGWTVNLKVGHKRLLIQISDIDGRLLTARVRKDAGK